MRDIADELGVTQATVSLVFRNKPGTSDEMRRKVLETADRLGYVRDESARALRSQRPTAIGVTFRTHQPFHDELLDGLYRAVSPGPHKLVLSAVSDSRQEKDAIEELISHRCGAAVILGPRITDEQLSVYSGRIPLIIVARRSDRPEIDWVTSDDQQGMDAVVDHLVSLGHRDIAYLSSSIDASGSARIDAFIQACEGRGVGEHVQVHTAGITENDGARGVEQMLAGNRRATAVVAFNDRCALGAMEALHRRGVRIPQDISLVGFDDSTIASRPTIDITSVHQDTGELARIAIERAAARMMGEEPAAGDHGQIVATRLVVRSSSGSALSS
ncbi:LacI family DNA-binding transcriptional regulator [Acidipropionibacterium virtanenii]|nr:LacI family DNA-binding transcriptional regulator [Acidipropionibacterium virtanenii]